MELQRRVDGGEPEHWKNPSFGARVVRRCCSIDGAQARGRRRAGAGDQIGGGGFVVVAELLLLSLGNCCLPRRRKEVG